MNLNGKTALVTGAASGIGKAAAVRLATAGAAVCVNDLAGKRAHGLELVEELRELGGMAFFQAADVSDEHDVAEMIGAVTAKWGHLDILVSNAGISGAGPDFFDLETTEMERMLTVNLKSQLLVTRAALMHMSERGFGRIVMISSVGGISSIVRCNPHYAAAKGGIVALARRLARDYGGRGITVNCVAPGLILDTGFNEWMPDEIVAAYVAQIPRGRAGESRDVAGLIAFLASDEADWITGQVIAVDGGAAC